MTFPRRPLFLLTGSTGFVGSRLAAHLWASGKGLRLLVRETSDLTRLPPEVYEAILEGDPNIELVDGDLQRPETLAGLCEGVKGVYHLACAVKGTFDESAETKHIFHDVNVTGTEHLAREAARAGVRMVHLSSTAAMGAVKESAVDENTRCNPQAPYQISKREAELRLLELHRTEGLNVVILRPCLILGPGKVGGEVLELFKLVQRGVFPNIGASFECTKPLIDVRDVTQACSKAMQFGTSGDVYLIHSGASHKLGDIIEASRRLIGARWGSIPLPSKPMRLAALGFETLAQAVPSFNPPLTRHRLDLLLTDRQISIEKARIELGYEPKYQDIYDMLGTTYVGYVKDGQLPR